MTKTNLFSSLIAKEFSKDKRKYLMLIGIFLIGIMTGTLLSSLSDSLSQIQNYVDTFISSYSLQGTIKSQVFFISLFNYGKFAFFLWVSGWYILLFPLCFLQVFSKGFRIGYTIACFVQCYHFRGILFSLLTMLPQNFIFLPSMFFFSVYQFHFLSDRRFLLSGKSAANQRQQIYWKNAIFLLLFLFTLLLSSLVEGYLIPSMLQTFCNFIL